jgi:hypothetical protein
VLPSSQSPKSVFVAIKLQKIDFRFLRQQKTTKNLRRHNGLGPPVGLTDAVNQPEYSNLMFMPTNSFNCFRAIAVWSKLFRRCCHVTVGFLLLSHKNQSVLQLIKLATIPLSHHSSISLSTTSRGSDPKNEIIPPPSTGTVESIAASLQDRT